MHVVETDRMLPEEEYLDVALLAIMDVMSTVLLNRTNPKSHRANRITLFKKELDRVDATYNGKLPKVFVEQSEHMYKVVEAGINHLIAYNRQEKENAATPTDTAL